MPQRNRYIDSVDRAQRRARGYTDLGATLGVGSFIYLFAVVLFFIFECIFYSYGSYNDQNKKQIPGCELSMASESQKNDKQFVLQSVTKHLKALDYAPKHFKSDKDIVLAAVTSDGNSLFYASENLKNDFDVVKTAVEQRGQALRYASNEMKSNKHIVLSAVNQDSESLLSVDNYLVEDKDVVLAAVKQGGYALRFAGESLKDDKEVVLAAVHQYSQSLLYASEELRDDIDVVSCAVAKDGFALRLVSDRMADNRDIVFLAVSNYGKALRFASARLKRDLHIVSAAIEQNGEAIQYINIASFPQDTYNHLCLSALSYSPAVVPLIDDDVKAHLISSVIEPQYQVKRGLITFLLCSSFSSYPSMKKKMKSLKLVGERSSSVRKRHRGQGEQEEGLDDKVEYQKLTPSSSCSSRSMELSHIWLLNDHGKQYAGIFKFKVAEYLGAIVGKEGARLRRVAEHLSAHQKEKTTLVTE